MDDERRPITVGIGWDALDKRPDQLRRIADAAGAEPIALRSDEPPPDVEVLVADSLPDNVPASTPRLRLVQLPSAGVEHLRDRPIWNSEVMIATASGVHGVQIAEHVFTLLLALRRHLPQYLELQRRHHWRHEATSDSGASIAPGELYGLTMGLIGYGHIGRAVAHLARAFGMGVIAVTPSTRETTPLAIEGASSFADPPAVPAPHVGPDELVPNSKLYDVLAQSDVVVICAPLTPQTANLLDATAIARIKRGAYVVNIARGKIVEEAALVRALRQGLLGGAGLDVTADEPLPADSPLWDMPNVIVTPHISGSSERYVERTVNVLLANLDLLRHGEPPLTLVDRRQGY